MLCVSLLEWRVHTSASALLWLAVRATSFTKTIQYFHFLCATSGQYCTGWTRHWLPLKIMPENDLKQLIHHNYYILVPCNRGHMALNPNERTNVRASVILTYQQLSEDKTIMWKLIQYIGKRKEILHWRDSRGQSKEYSISRHESVAKKCNYKEMVRTAQWNKSTWLATCFT